MRFPGRDADTDWRGRVVALVRDGLRSSPRANSFHDSVIPTTTTTRNARGVDEFAAVVADSAGMRHALHMARRIATTPLRTLLLNGEAGTGKELVARCIHNAGLNANAPFVSINCSSIPLPLLEVELFGIAPARNDAPR